jgi:hypothetical protein
MAARGAASLEWSATLPQPDNVRVARDPLRMANSRQTFMTQALARAGPRHNCNVELLYRRRTRRACSLFQRLALPQRLLFAKSATALTIIKSSVCQNDSFWRATPDPGVLLNQVHAPGRFLRLQVNDERPRLSVAQKS